MTEPVTSAKLLEDLQVLIRDAEALLQATASYSGDRVAEVRARAEDSLQQARNHLGEMQDTVLEEARQAAATAEGYVQRNPWSALGLAASAGLVVGLLLRRRD